MSLFTWYHWHGTLFSSSKHEFYKVKNVKIIFHECISSLTRKTLIYLCYLNTHTEHTHTHRVPSLRCYKNALVD